jgi:hypothetical protein
VTGGARTGGGRGRPYLCPHCGAERLHRSHPRTLLETLGRAVLRLRIYRCHACELRIRTFSRPERAGAEHASSASGRALERRDRMARRRRQRAILLTAIVAAAIGTAVAKWFVLD